MTTYDIFNGDADGICALTQLRNAYPLKSELITGVKRDIQLLNKISPQAGDSLNVLDISFDKNRAAVINALESKVQILYMDHHFAGDIPEHKQLTAIINTTPDTCTSLLMNKYLKGQFKEWAIVGAFGDNLKNSARSLAKSLHLSEQQLTTLEKLGIYINYNGYGSSLEDLHFHPKDLYRAVSKHTSPFDFLNDGTGTFNQLENGYKSDMSCAAEIRPTYSNDSVAAYILPNQAWANRVSGVYSNDLANQAPSIAHAVLTEKDNGHYLISLRAPLENKTGADELCRQFPTGGGRAAAAGINDLPAEMLEHFLETFQAFYKP